MSIIWTTVYHVSYCTYKNGVNDRATIFILKENLQAKEIVYCNFTFTYNYHTIFMKFTVIEVS